MLSEIVQQLIIRSSLLPASASTQLRLDVHLFVSIQVRRPHLVSMLGFHFAVYFIYYKLEKLPEATAEDSRGCRRLMRCFVSGGARGKAGRWQTVWKRK